MLHPRLARALTGMLLVSLLSSGCSTRAKPLSVAFGGLTFAPDAAGLRQMLVKLPSLPVEERQNQLRAFCDSSADKSLKAKSGYVLGRLLQKSGNQVELKEAIDRYGMAANLPALWERANWHVAECAQALS